jgi:V8-like Glu-specific endopeptidase
MSENPELQQALEDRIAASREQRLQTVRSYLNHDWLGMAGTRQTYDRLVRKGHRDKAEQLLDLTERGLTPSATRPEGLEQASFAIDPVAESQLAEIGETVFEAVIGRSEIMSVYFLHEGSQVAHSVGRIITYPGRIANGTGFLVSPRLLLTNHHVLRSQLAARRNIVQFGYYARDDGGPIEPAEFEFRPEEFFVTSPVTDLDFSLVAVAPVNRESYELTQFGWSVLIAELGKAQEGERLNIVHHPQGLPQQISIRRNFLTSMLDRFMHYVTDTMPGSSGSPVYNEEWEVVALHHASREITDPQEIQLYLQVLRGVEHDEGLGAGDSNVTVNEGIRVSQVVKWLKNERAHLSQAQRGLLDQALGGPPPPWTSLPSARRGSMPLAPEAGPLPSVTSLQVDGNGRATWTIPLRVSVGLGLGAVAASAASLPAAIGTTGGGLTPALQEAEARLELFTDEVSRQKSVFRALAFLQEARQEVYLPADDVIARRKADYYGDLVESVANGLGPSELYEALHELVHGTLQLVRSFPETLPELESLSQVALESGLQLESDTQYAKARAHLYTWVDLQEDRMLRCVYTQTVIAPEQLMLKDLITQLGHADLLPQRFRSNQYLNCEHIVPQSWFDKVAIGVSDLHHLITADGAANNFRSDCAYHVLDDNGQEGPEDRPPYIPVAGVKNETDSTFEPRNGKPVVARATLYFMIAHKRLIDDSKYGPEEIEMLIAWAKSSPPSRYELHRNEAIFVAQGNRNPLIDFPEWIDHIDFARGVSPASP